MQYRRSVVIDASADRIWAILGDVEAWPRWTPTVTALTLDRPRLEPGATATITQPGRRPVGYTVLHLAEGSRFTWGSERRGVRQWADHVVAPREDQRCDVHLTFAMEGPVGGLLGLLGRATIRRFVDTEAEHLAAAAERPVD